jgi:hypothetical protein
MKMAWSLHKLANLLNSEGNIRPSNIQIVQASYQLLEHSGISKKITLLTSIFHIDLVNPEDPLAQSNPGYICADSRIYLKNPLYFQTQKILKRTKIFHMKKSLKILLEVANQGGVSANNDNIIHIYK